MRLLDIAKNNADFYVPRFEIEIKGQKLKGSMERIVVDLTVREKIDEGVSFSFTVNDEFDLKKQEFKWLDHELFQVGNEIKIRLGYGNNLEELIIGKITGMEPSFFAGEIPTIAITGQDLSYDHLKRSSPEKTFRNMTYSEIAEKIAHDAKLKPVVDTSKIKVTRKTKDTNQSFFQFLEDMAKEIEFVFFVSGRNMYFIKPPTQGKEVLVLQLGRDLISFRPYLKTTDIVTEVEVRGHNPKEPAKPIIGRAKAEGPLIKGRYLTIGPLSKKIDSPIKRVLNNVIVSSVSHANSVARSVLERANSSLIEGEGSTIGISRIRAGVNIKIEKVGKIFSGKYYVTETTHTINNSGYTTKFSVMKRV